MQPDKRGIEDLVALIAKAQEESASDLHLTVEAPPTVRVDGDLRQLQGVGRLSREWLENVVRATLPEAVRETFLQLGEADFSWSLPGQGRFRMNAYRQRGSAALAIRFISPRPPTASELGLPPAVQNLACLAKGLVIVTGPAGSGKSTTLAALIDVMNRERSAHIITLEDPIEYLHHHGRSLIEQREVGSDTLSFAAGLRAALRQDPDVIFLGEMRDLDTVTAALAAAETGHLVLSTLHTGSATGAVERIVDVFPPEQKDAARAQLALVLEGVVAQALLVKAGGPGRVAAWEVLIATPAVRNLIREGKAHQLISLMQAGSQWGMRTLAAAVDDLIRGGMVNAEAGAVAQAHIAGKITS